MSTEATAGISPSIDLARAKRQGLRVALAVTLGFSIGLVNGSVLPFLAPLFATQFLLASYSPPGLRQGVGTVLLIFIVGALLIFSLACSVIGRWCCCRCCGCATSPAFSLRGVRWAARDRR